MMSNVIHTIPAPGRMARACPMCGSINQNNKHTRMWQQPAQTNRMNLICKDFNMKNGCPNGSDCSYMHVYLRCAFFETETGCRNGNDCAFQHVLLSQYPNMPTPAQFKGLTTNKVGGICPTEGCTNTCIDRQCKECHTKVIVKRREEKRAVQEWASHEVQKTDEYTQPGEAAATDPVGAAAMVV